MQQGQNEVCNFVSMLKKTNACAPLCTRLSTCSQPDWVKLSESDHCASVEGKQTAGGEQWVRVILHFPNQTETPSVQTHSWEWSCQQLRILICFCFITLKHMWGLETHEVQLISHAAFISLRSDSTISWPKFTHLHWKIDACSIVKQ